MIVLLFVILVHIIIILTHPILSHAFIIKI